MGVRLCPVARRKEPPGYAGAAQVEGGNPMEGVTVPPKTAHANGRFGPWFPRSAALRIGGLVAIAGRIIGPGEIGHDGGPRLRVILQVETEAVRFVGVDARLVLDGKRPLGNVGALAHVDPGVFRFRFGEWNAFGEEIHGTQRLECVLAQIDIELVALPRSAPPCRAWACGSPADRTP